MRVLDSSVIVDCHRGSTKKVWLKSKRVRATILLIHSESTTIEAEAFQKPRAGQVAAAFYAFAKESVRGWNSEHVVFMLKNRLQERQKKGLDLGGKTRT